MKFLCVCVSGTHYKLCWTVCVNQILSVTVIPNAQKHPLFCKGIDFRYVPTASRNCKFLHSNKLSRMEGKEAHKSNAHIHTTYDELNEMNGNGTNDREKENLLYCTRHFNRWMIVELNTFIWTLPKSIDFSKIRALWLRNQLIGNEISRKTLKNMKKNCVCAKSYKQHYERELVENIYAKNIIALLGCTRTHTHIQICIINRYRKIQSNIYIQYRRSFAQRNQSNAYTHRHTLVCALYVYAYEDTWKYDYFFFLLLLFGHFVLNCFSSVCFRAFLSHVFCSPTLVMWEPISHVLVCSVWIDVCTIDSIEWIMAFQFKHKTKMVKKS